VYGLFHTLRNLKAKDLSRKLTDAADLIKDPDTKRKVIAGIIIGSAAASTIWALRTYQAWKAEHERLGLLDWMMSERDEEQ
jgi:hypothetical protein